MMLYRVISACMKAIRQVNSLSLSQAADYSDFLRFTHF